MQRFEGICGALSRAPPKALPLRSAKGSSTLYPIINKTPVDLISAGVFAISSFSSREAV